jgi:Lysyl oxidase
LRRRGLITVFAVLALLGGAASARADDKGSFALPKTRSTAAWRGSMSLGAFTGGAPPSELCAGTVACDVAELHVKLPRGTWRGRPGGVLVAIQWPYIDAGYDLDLYVYGPDGSQVASSDTLAFSRNEGAWIKNPRNGTYRVVIAPKLVWGVPRALADRLGRPNAGPLDYRAFVEFERGVTIHRLEQSAGLWYVRTIIAHGRRSANPVRPLLPDLISTKPANFHIESGQGAHFYFFMDRGLRHQPSCYPQETTGLNTDPPSPRVDGPTRCLRWDQGEYNFGAGPLELHNYSNKGDGTNLYQRVYSTDGSITQKLAGAVKFSSTHGHFHAQGFQDIGLYARRPGGGRGRLIARPPSKGICMVDIENGNFARTDRPTNPLQMDLPGTCDASIHQDPNDPTYPNEPFLQMGITPGFADVYPWFVADQYIDISKIPDGRYVLRATVNRSRRIRESNYTNNSRQSCVEIRGTTARAC